jgi:hypothetical protein
MVPGKCSTSSRRTQEGWSSRFSTSISRRTVRCRVFEVSFERSMTLTATSSPVRVERMRETRPNAPVPSTASLS